MTTTRTGLPPAPARPHQALAFCNEQHLSGSTAWYQYCQKLAHDEYGIPAVEPDAWSAWLHAKGRHPCTSADVDWAKVPVGAHLFYRGGDHGHVATYRGILGGQPLCWTNDAAGHGLVSTVNPLWFEAHWAHYLVGWTEDNNGYDLGLTIDGQQAPQWVKEPPPKDPPPAGPPAGAGHLLDEWQRATGAAVHAGQAFVAAQPNRPVLKAVSERQSADWAVIHDAATPG